MSGTRTHRYRIANRWTGDKGAGTSSYTAYSRNHELSAEGKSAVIPGSSDPHFRGDPARYNPEELLLASASACHMLWVLHWCSDAGIVVTEYDDDAIGEMIEHPDGSAEFTQITLRPRMKITDPSRTAELAAIHHKVHEVCAIARSLRCPVSIEV